MPWRVSHLEEERFKLLFEIGSGLKSLWETVFNCFEWNTGFRASPIAIRLRHGDLRRSGCEKIIKLNVVWTQTMTPPSSFKKVVLYQPGG